MSAEPKAITKNVTRYLSARSVSYGGHHGRARIASHDPGGAGEGAQTYVSGRRISNGRTVAPVAQCLRRQQRIEDQRAQEAQKIENQRAQAERELAEQQAQDEALQAYLDQMTSLLLEKNLRESEKGSEVRILAQARTATVIQALDAHGNRNVIRFLQEAKLTGDIYRETPSAISLLAETDWQGARLEGADLSGIDLAYTILDDAHLRGTAPEWLPNVSLARADMSRTYLEDSSLVGANLKKALPRDAYLGGTNLLNADLSGADLSGAKAITNEKLEQRALSLEGATMPNGQKYEEWLKGREKPQQDE